MPLFVKITSPKIWAIGDYTTDAAHDINMTVYIDPQFTAAKDLTSYTTIRMRLVDPNHNGYTLQDTNEGITVDASGNLTWKPSISGSPQFKGLVKVRPRFEKSGEKLTAIGVAGSDELMIKYD